MSTPDRAELLAEMTVTMRVFMAHALLFHDAVARAAGMSPTDVQCVNLLLLDGPATAGELAARAGLTAGAAVTGVIDRLERAGLAHRSRDLEDRRRVVVTADERQVGQRLGPAYHQIGMRWGEYLATLDDDQVAFANQLFAKAAEVNRDETARLRSPRRSDADGRDDLPRPS